MKSKMYLKDAQFIGSNRSNKDYIIKFPSYVHFVDLGKYIARGGCCFFCEKMKFKKISAKCFKTDFFLRNEDVNCKQFFLHIKANTFYSQIFNQALSSVL